MVFVVLHLFDFCTLEGTHALEHFVPVNLVSVELRTVDADELRLASDGQSASTAHTGTVDHDGVQRHIGRNIVFLSEQTRELHHDGRANGEDTVYVRLLLDELLNTNGHHTFFTIRTVVGHNDDFVRRLAHLILHDDQVLGAACKHGEHTVASSLQGLDDGQHRSYAHTTTGANHGAEVLDVCGITQRAYHVGNHVAFVQTAQLC